MADNIQPGDRFAAVDAPTIVWVAAHVIERRGEPSRHVVLIQEKHRHRDKTLSESVLLDPRFFRRMGRS